MKHELPSGPRIAVCRCFPSGPTIELERGKLLSPRLRETNDGNRLTVDADAVRIEIGRSANEIERERLYRLLARRYSPAPAEGPYKGSNGDSQQCQTGRV